MGCEKKVEEIDLRGTPCPIPELIFWEKVKKGEDFVLYTDSKRVISASKELGFEVEEDYSFARITRRSFLSSLAGVPLVSMLSSLEMASALELNLLPMDCFSCSISICFCGAPPRPALQANYWFPVGFLEANKECEFLTSMIPIVGSLVETPLRGICKAIPIVLPTVQVQNVPSGVVGQDYMRFHARWYSLPKPLQEWVEKVLLTLKLCPCIGINWIFEKLLNLPLLSEGLKVYQELMSKVNEVENKVKENIKSALGPVLDKVKGFIPSTGSGGSMDFSKAKDILTKLNDLRKWIPLVITEPFSPLWLVDLMSVDNVTAPAIANAIHTLITSFSPPLGALSCPFLVQELIKRNLLPRELTVKGVSVLDLEFICVGYWGHGYPRIGVVRHDDPYIARLLALARFHHLFSKTFPIIPVPLSMNPDEMKYQIWSPLVSPCFGVGRYGVPTLDDIKDLTNTDKLVEKFKSIGWETIKSAMVRGVREQDRKMMVIVWKKERRCCC